MTNQDASYKDKVKLLRDLMAETGVDGFLVPRADEYQGEFVAPYAERLKWLTGFTGSAGMAVILTERAALFTDARYTLQAPQQVDTGLYEVVDSAKRPAAEWLKENAGEGAVIGYDPWLHTDKQLAALSEKGLVLKPLDTNVLDQVWHDQPARPVGQVELFPEAFAGRSSADKRTKITGQLAEDDLDGFIFTLPDSIAWLLNIRGSDVDYIPYALSYALLESDGSVLWFIDPAKVSVDLGEGIKVVDPGLIGECLGALQGKNIAIDFARAPVWFKSRLEEGAGQAHDFKDPAIAPKARKTQAEQDAVKQAHIRDGAALVNFLCWLEEEAPKGQLTELDIAAKLEECRSAFPEHRGPSFPTIAGFGANGAIVHYRATEETNSAIKAPGLLLVDSGGQYIDGTTDITRTIAIGDISDEMKHHFTLVLKGHIAVASAVFKKGTLGKEIDALARAPLQAEDLNFAHGTGHGVGCYLAVHEEAANLSPKGENALEPGMLLSNEPGYYQEKSHGIRTENLVLVQQKGEALYFETISLAPIDMRAIDWRLLDEAELRWLNAYHKKVYDVLSPLLGEELKGWLLKKTQAL